MFAFFTKRFLKKTLDKVKMWRWGLDLIQKLLMTTSCLLPTGDTIEDLMKQTKVLNYFKSKFFYHWQSRFVLPKFGGRSSYFHDSRVIFYRRSEIWILSLTNLNFLPCAVINRSIESHFGFEALQSKVWDLNKCILCW